MKRSRQRIDELIDHLQNDQCTPEELALIRRWILEMDLNDPAIAPETMEEIKMRMYRELIEGIHSVPVIRAGNRTRIWKYIAVAALIIIAGLPVFRMYMDRRTVLPASQAAYAWTVIANDQDLVRKLVMPDGTVVWLNRDSRIEFDDHQYNRSQRFVRLSGEAFFEVKKDTSKPFVVETGNLFTRVLGTAFNIEAYHQESEIRVSLVHGKVELGNKTDEQIALLAPNQTLRYSKQTKTWQVLPVAVSNIGLWTEGHLVFNEVPLQEVLERVEKRYQVHIEYDPALMRSKRITANFMTGSWETALQNILFVHGLSYRKEAGRVIIIKNRTTK